MVAAVLHLHEGARAALDRVDHVRGGLAHGEDVVDARLLEIVDAEVRQRAVIVALQLLLVAEHEVDLVHGREARRVGLRGAAGDDDPRARILAARLADRLLGLAHGLGRHGAGVEDHRAVLQLAQARRRRLAAHDFRLVGVEPAAEGDDVDAHQAALSVSRAQAPVAGSKLPENSHSAGPVMMT